MAQIGIAKTTITVLLVGQPLKTPINLVLNSGSVSIVWNGFLIKAQRTESRRGRQSRTTEFSNPVALRISSLKQTLMKFAKCRSTAPP